MPNQPKIAPRAGFVGNAKTPKYAAKLKFGPGNACSIANPSKKSLESTQPVYISCKFITKS